MPTVNMPHQRPSQLDALSAALNIGQVLYGIKYKGEELERQKVADAQNLELNDLKRSQLFGQIKQQQDQELAQQKISKGEFNTPLEAQATLSKLGYRVSTTPPSKEELSIPITIAGQKYYANSSKDINEQLKGLEYQSKLLELKRQPEKYAQDQALKEQELKNLSAIEKEINAKTQEKIASIGKGKYNNEQTRDAGFALRMDQSNNILNGLSQAGFDPTSSTSTLQSKFGFLEPFKGEQQKQYDQAKRSFINAQLRRESGSAIAASEFDSANKQYFPQIGDTPEVLKQKLVERTNAIEAMKFSSAGSYDELMKSQNIQNAIAKQSSILDKIIAPAAAERSPKKIDLSKPFRTLE
jgi:hypothetical protein